MLSDALQPHFRSSHFTRIRPSRFIISTRLRGAAGTGAQKRRREHRSRASRSRPPRRASVGLREGFANPVPAAPRRGIRHN
jgi:hypothetical protein